MTTLELLCVSFTAGSHSVVCFCIWHLKNVSLNHMGLVGSVNLSSLVWVLLFII